MSMLWSGEMTFPGQRRCLITSSATEERLIGEVRAASDSRIAEMGDGQHYGMEVKVARRRRW